MNTQTLKINGMHCNACALNIDISLEELPGVTAVKTSLDQQQTIITFDEQIVSLDQIRQAIQKTGYSVANEK